MCTCHISVAYRMDVSWTHYCAKLVSSQCMVIPHTNFLRIKINPQSPQKTFFNFVWTFVDITTNPSNPMQIKCLWCLRSKHTMPTLLFTMEWAWTVLDTIWTSSRKLLLLLVISFSETIVSVIPTNEKRTSKIYFRPWQKASGEWTSSPTMQTHTVCLPWEMFIQLHKVSSAH